MGKSSQKKAQPIDEFPVSYSTLSSDALRERVLSNYHFHNAPHCEYLYRGLNDNYLVRDGETKYILRVYRYGWRDLRDIQTELDLLQYLKKNGVSVSFPIPDKKDNFIREINAPEGVRYSVLFSYAKGSAVLSAMTGEQSRNLGRELAKMHSLTANMRLKNGRCHLDVISLLDESFYAVRPYIEDRREDLLIFEEVIGRLKGKFDALDLKDLSYGICHGDMYPSNYHASENEITLFDFDACCCSWLVSDIAAFCYASIHSFEESDTINHAFLSGYQERRELRAREIEVVPYFGAVNHIWVLATQCANFEIFCHFVRSNIKKNIIRNLKKYTEQYCP